MFEKLSKLLFSFLTAVSLCATSYASAIQASETPHTNELIVTQKQTQSDSPLLLNTEIIANENPQEASLSADNAFLSARKAFKNKNIKAKTFVTINNLDTNRKESKHGLMDVWI